MSARVIIDVTGVVAAGLMAGLFFGWLVSVIPGTMRVDDATYISTMQSINIRIVNPGFVIPFFGVPLLLGGAAYLEHRAGNDRRAGLLAVAAVTYLVGVLGVTAGGNIPLNNALDAFDLGQATPTSAADRRVSYETPWNRWHVVRTVAAVGSAAIATAALTAAEAE